jgi:pyruvate dehydrogenase E1 component alpha subunit
MSTPTRSKDLGMIPGLPAQFSEEETLEVYKRMWTSRAFEFQAKKAYDAGLLVKAPIYLSLGEEAIPAALSMAYPKPFIFAQIRAHGYYLAYGGDPVALIDELFGRTTGCAHGMGGSGAIHSPAIGMFGHNQFIGDQIPIAVGFALGNEKDTLAVMGDASAEEDYVMGALGYAASRKLPILFICSDNDRSILTKVAVRRTWKMVDVARSFGMEAVEITDDPWLIMHHVRLLKNKRPAFINIHTARDVWHAGTGNDGDAEWHRSALVKEELGTLGLAAQAIRIEADAEQWAAALWKKQTAIKP